MITGTTPANVLRRLLGHFLAVLLFCGVVNGCAQSVSTSAIPANSSATKDFLIIAHRGASGYRPEHTLAAYQLAIDQGADFIEPDLVPTRDGHLIARHENALALVELPKTGTLRDLQESGAFVVHSATTDVAERTEFAHLLRVREIDGRKVAGWFSEDFTLAEIKTLWAAERIPELRPANTRYTRERIPSLQDIVALTQKAGNQHIGLYPELKHPTHFRFGRRLEDDQPINIDTAKLLVSALSESPFLNHQPLYIQCFEVETLRRLRHKLLPPRATDAQAEPQNLNVRLVQLFGPMSATPADVAHHRKNSSAAEFATVYGPLHTSLNSNPSYGGIADALDIVATDYAKGLGPRKGDTNKLASRARALGLDLHPYTVRAEPFFLSPLRGGLAKTVAEELTALRAMGATGVFIDQPDLAVSWRDQQTAPTP